MTVVVADTTPLNYLALIDEIEVLPRLYGRVLAPPQFRVAQDSEIFLCYDAG